MQGKVVNERYTLIELLGSGGIADVYLAHDEVLDRDVALKILKDEYANDQDFVERFRSEAQSAARLTHPNIVSIYDQGRSEEGAYYIAMEYVPWGTLKDRIRRDGALEPGAAVGVALQIADTLSSAHKQRVIHGDVRAQNVLVTRRGDIRGTNDIIVADFGIARAASSSPVAAPVVVLDSAGYMSPEQAKGESVGPRSDLYSLGVVLYEMLTGELPYAAEDQVSLMVKHANEPPRSPREAKPAVPEALDAVTLRLLAKSPEDRYASAEELLYDLEQVHPRLPTVASTGTPERRQGGVLVPATVASLLFVLIMLGSLAWALAPEQPNGQSKAPAQQEKQGEFQKLMKELSDELDGKQPVQGVSRRGWTGNDILKGTDERDALGGHEGDDELWGYDGDDKIGGGQGSDILYGGAGSDALIGYAANDSIDDGDDGVEDIIMCGEGFDTVTAGAEDTLVGCEDVTIR